MVQALQADDRMRAVVMCGGRGERLRPLTDTCPKPLLPVAGRPVLDRLLETLSLAAVRDVTLAIGYLGEMVQDYVGDGSKWGLAVDYVMQPYMMGTAGPLTLLPRKDRPVLVVNGDKIYERWKDITKLRAGYEVYGGICVGVKQHRLPYGVVERGRFREKPIVYACAGAYTLPAGVIQGVKAPSDMPDILLGDVVEVSFWGYVLDIGTPQSYQDACMRLSAGNP